MPHAGSLAEQRVVTCFLWCGRGEVCPDQEAAKSKYLSKDVDEDSQGHVETETIKSSCLCNARRPQINEISSFPSPKNSISFTTVRTP